MPEFRIGPVRIHPLAGVEERFDSNVFLQASEEQWDFLTRLTARLDLRVWHVALADRKRAPLPGDTLFFSQSQTELLNEIDSVLVFPSDLAAFYAAGASGGRKAEEAPGAAGEREDAQEPRAFLFDLGYQGDGWLFPRENGLDTYNQAFSALAAARLFSGVALTLVESYFDRTTSTGDPGEFASYASGLRSVGTDFDQNVTGLRLTILLGNRTFVTPEYLFYLSRVLTDPFEPLGYQFHRFGLQAAHSFGPRTEVSALYQGGWIQGEADKESLFRIFNELTRDLTPRPPPPVIPFQEDPRNGIFHQGLLSAGYTVTARLRLQAQIGAQVRNFDEAVFTSYVDVIGKIEGSYRVAERTILTARFYREPVDIASADGTFLTRTGGELSLSHKLEEKIDLKAKGYYYHDVFDEQSALVPRGREDDAFGFQAGAQYDIQPWLQAGASYLFSDRASNVAREDTVDHRVSLFAVLVH